MVRSFVLARAGKPGGAAALCAQCSTEYAERCYQVSVRADGSVSLLYLDRDAFNRCVRAVASQRLRSRTARREMQRTTGRAGLTLRC